MKDVVIAIVCSDMHLSHQPPRARREEPDWYEAMKRPLDQIRTLVDRYDAPIVCAGDIFDRWNSPPEIINFAIRHLPNMYAVAGNHDLPLHNYQDIKKSAYWTLVEAGVIINLEPGQYINHKRLCLWGFPCGSEIKPLKANRDFFHLAVVHKYIWEDGHGFTNASDDDHVSATMKRLKGFNAAVFGDNHIGFIKKNLINCGALIRRNIDQVNYRPMVGLLHASGKIEPCYLKCGTDSITLRDDNNTDTASFGDLIQYLSDMQDQSMDFASVLKSALENPDNKLTKETKASILAALDKALLRT